MPSACPCHLRAGGECEAPNRRLGANRLAPARVAMARSEALSTRLAGVTSAATMTCDEVTLASPAMLSVQMLRENALRIGRQAACKPC